LKWFTDWREWMDSCFQSIALAFVYIVGL
jgi:hypothetical protein